MAALEATEWLRLARRYGPVRVLTDREAWEIESALEASENTQGPAKAIIDSWLIGKAMSLGKWGSAYSWLTKTNAPGNWTVVAYHHPARLCWSWLVSVTFGKRAARGWKCFQPYRYGQIAVWIPYVMEVRFCSQNYDWMLSGNAKNLLTFLCQHSRATKQ